MDASQLDTVYIVGLANPAVQSHAVNILNTIGIDAVKQFTAGALQNTVLIEVIAVTGCGNSSTPSNHRVTAFTEGTASIAIGSTSRSHIFNCFCSMNVVRGLIDSACQTSRIPLSSGLLLQGAKGAGSTIGLIQDTLFYMRNHRYQSITRSILIAATTIVMEHRRPHADRHRSQYCVSCTSHIAGTGNGNRSIVGFCINRISCREALRQLHVSQFPLAILIQINNSSDLIYVLNSSRFQIHPNHRIFCNILQRGVLGNITDCILSASTLQRKIIFHKAGLITHHIANLETDNVSTIGQGNISSGNHASIRAGSINFHAIHINCHSAGIQTRSSIHSISSKCHIVGGQRLTLDCNSSIQAFIADGRIANYRNIVIFHSRGIIDCKIINVEHNICIIIGVLVVEISITSIIGITMIQSDFVQIGYISTNILNRHSKILPTGTILLPLTQNDRDCGAKVPFDTMRAFGNIHPEA